MRYSVYFFLFALLFFWVGGVWRTLPVPGGLLFTAGFWYAGAANVFMGLVYLAASLFRVNPGPLFKRPDGTVRVLPRLLAWPFFLFESVGWRGYRKRTREALFTRVAEGLYLGARVTDRDVPRLSEAGINAVLDLAAEFSGPRSLRSQDGIRYLSLPVLDGAALTMPELARGVDFVVQARKDGGVLVHCIYGHGRSATMAAAALIASGEAASAQEAVKRLHGRGRAIHVSRDQRRLLRAYHARLSR